MGAHDEDRSAESPFGVWATSMDNLVSYRYLGCSSMLQDRLHAEGSLRMRRDLRTQGGLLSAPLAISALDTAGITIDRHYQVAPTQIDVHLFDDGDGLDEVRILGDVLREARTQVFTEARLEDRADPERVVAWVTTDWAIMAPTPPGYEYVDPSPGVADSPDLPPLAEAYDASRRGDGTYVINGLSPRVGAVRLHHGPMLVALEAAALDAARASTGTDALRVEHCSTRIVTSGKVGPFVASAVVVAQVGPTVACRAELRDQGAGDVPVAVALLRARTTLAG